MDFRGFYSGKGFKQTGTASAANCNFLNVFTDKSFYCLKNNKNIHFLFWPVVPANSGCNCRVSIGDSLDFDPCASSPRRLHLPSPLLPADLPRCEAAWVNQWVLPSVSLKIRFCAFLTCSLGVLGLLLILQLEVRSSPTCPHLFKACGPSEHFRQRTGSRKPLMTIKTCTHVRNFGYVFLSRRNFDRCRVIYLFVLREQKPGSCFWPRLVGSLFVLMGSVPSLLQSLPLAACSSETVRRVFRDGRQTQWDSNESLWILSCNSSCFPVAVELDAGSVGLALTYAVTLMGMFQWAVRQSAEVENLVSLKKIKYK